MGTSKGYDAPTTPQWAHVKTSITTAVQLPELSANRAASILKEYVGASGGSTLVSRGGGSLGSGGSAQRTARNLGAFARAVSGGGLGEALSRAGLPSPDTASPSEVASFLTNYLSEGAQTIEDADARAAMSRLLRDLLADVSEDGVDETLAKAFSPAALIETMRRYFANYLFEQFCRVAYDRLVAKVGDARADEFLTQIRRYIAEQVGGISAERDLSQVDWSAPEGKSVSEEVFEGVLFVFGG